MEQAGQQPSPPEGLPGVVARDADRSPREEGENRPPVTGTEVDGKVIPRPPQPPHQIEIIPPDLGDLPAAFRHLDDLVEVGVGFQKGGTRLPNEYGEASTGKRFLHRAEGRCRKYHVADLSQLDHQDVRRCPGRPGERSVAVKCTLIPKVHVGPPRGGLRPIAMHASSEIKIEDSAVPGKGDDSPRH